MDRIEQEGLAEVRQRLVRRLVLAGGLILVLLGALAGFDHLSKMDQDEEARLASPPVQPKIGPSISSGRPPEPPLDEPVTPSPALAPNPVPAEPAVPPLPEIAAQPSPGTPPVAAAPVTPSVPVEPQGVASPVPPDRPATPPAPPPAPVIAAVPEESSGAPMVSAPPASGKRLSNPSAEVTSGSAPKRSPLSRLATGFIVQAGVFSSPERAEEVKAKLIMAGVPATIESRVQVGPFATQKEADAARKKIRELGVDSIVIPPRGARR